MNLTPTDRHGLQCLAFWLALPITATCFVAGFLWQFADWGWTLGNVAFNHFFERQ
jgi:hypothetical protein